MLPFHGFIVSNRRWLIYALGLMLIFVGIVILIAEA